MRTFTRCFTTVCVFLLLITAAACKKRREVLNDRVTPHDYLSSSKYEKLVVEINYVNGYAPTERSIQELTSFLQSILNKPSGIFVKTSVVTGGGSSYYTLSDIKEIEKKNRKEVTKGNTITAYILFLDKEYVESLNSSSKILGIHYGTSSMAIFENTIRNYSGGLTQPSVSSLETVVCEHEFGHALGLTNNGTAMQVNHQDPNHSAHCNNKNCLMYYATETSDIIANLTGNSIPQLDDNCRADLRANGGR
ncbi:MAG TPA: peptidase [Bacteroidia bacterium]